MQVRNNVREARSQRGLSRADLSSLVSITPETLDRIELGLSIPKIHTVLKLCHVLETDAKKLFSLPLSEYEKLNDIREVWSNKKKARNKG